MNIFKAIGNWFKQTAKDAEQHGRDTTTTAIAVQQPTVYEIGGKVYNIDDPRLEQLLWLFENDKGEWDYRYECKEGCGYHAGILHNYRPCQKCGGPLYEYKSHPYKYFYSVGIWVRRDKLLYVIENLKKMGLKAKAPDTTLYGRRTTW